MYKINNRAKFICHGIIGFSCLFSGPLNSIYASCDKTGPAIMKEQNERQSARTEQEEQEIVILDIETKKKETRTMKRFMSKKSEDDKKSVMYFETPQTIKGSGLLSWKSPQEENQWLYIPELKKLQRIASGSRKNYFMGTDFTFADLEGEDLKKNTYTCTQEVSCQKGKSTCYVITATPLNAIEARDIGYSKRMLLVDKKDLITLNIAYFDLKGTKLKTAEYANWVEDKKLWRPNLAIMDRHGVQKTFIKVKARSLNITIDEKVLTKRFLEKEMHIK
jgi:hypothetical protein